MATETSSIDDLLMGIESTGTQTPETPEEDAEIDSHIDDNDEYEESETEIQDTEESEEQEDTIAEEEKIVIDEYGNEKERMPKGMKERFDRKDKKHKLEIEQRESEINALRMQLAQQGASQQVQQAAKDFEYDPNSDGDWQQQLKQFVRHEITSVTTEEQQKQQRYEEAKTQAEFEGRFRQDVDRFPDFEKVITELEAQIDDPMMYAIRGTKNPAAFLYAAAKRAPQELQRIAKMKDPYAKVAAMGALEVTLKQTKPMTKAPKPVGRFHEDNASMPKKKDPKDPNSEGYIEDLIGRADAKRKAQITARRK